MPEAASICFCKNLKASNEKRVELKFPLLILKRVIFWKIWRPGIYEELYKPSTAQDYSLNHFVPLLRAACQRGPSYTPGSL